MPISQPRLLTVIQAAEHFATRFADLRELTESYLTQARTGALAPLEALEQLALMLDSRGDTQHTITITAERTKHDLTFRDNARRAQAAARKRGAGPAAHPVGPAAHPPAAHPVFAPQPTATPETADLPQPKIPRQRWASGGFAAIPDFAPIPTQAERDQEAGLESDLD